MYSIFIQICVQSLRNVSPKGQIKGFAFDIHRCIYVQLILTHVIITIII